MTSFVSRSNIRNNRKTTFSRHFEKENVFEACIERWSSDCIFMNLVILHVSLLRSIAELKGGDDDVLCFSEQYSK
jgi:hypothetical protein